MNKGRSVVVLFTAITVLLALNILLVVSPRASAAEEVRNGEPYVVRYLPDLPGVARVHRVWSDGQIDWMTRTADECDEWIFGDVIADAVDHPAPVVEANTNGTAAFTLEYADGRVDFINSYINANNESDYLRCTIVGAGGAPFCRGDTDRDGVTDVVDLLTVLADWGACTEG